MCSSSDVIFASGPLDVSFQLLQAHQFLPTRRNTKMCSCPSLIKSKNRSVGIDATTLCLAFYWVVPSSPSQSRISILGSELFADCSFFYCAHAVASHLTHDSQMRSEPICLQIPTIFPLLASQASDPSDYQTRMRRACRVSQTHDGNALQATTSTSPKLPVMLFGIIIIITVDPAQIGFQTKDFWKREFQLLRVPSCSATLVRVTEGSRGRRGQRCT